MEKENALKLSPNIKVEFKNLCDILSLDKSTKLRSIYLFEEFLKKTQSQIHKNQQSLFLRVATFVSCKSMTFSPLTGKQIKGTGIFVNKFLEECNFE